jgi:hypothetical protein
MTFGELLTKLAIIATAWSTWKSELFVSRTAIIFAVVLLLISFWRDANLRQRGIVRMLPPFGPVCVLSVAMFLFLTEVVCHWLCDSVFMKPEESVMGGCWTALGVQCITVACEAANRRAFNYLFGWDEGEFDRIQGRSYGTQQQHVAPQPPPPVTHVTPVIEVPCPRCGCHNDWRAPACQSCGYGRQAPTAQQPVCRLPRL